MPAMNTTSTDTSPLTLVLVNRQSGTVRGMGEDAARQLIEDAFSGKHAEIHLIEGGDVIETVQRALKQRHVDRIIVGGGDGTVASVAGELAGTDVALGVLPLGTMNMVAKVIGMAPDLRQALAQMQTAEVKILDAARAGERLFLHHVSFGIQPRMVKMRERLGYSSRVTKMLAGVRAFVDRKSVV